MIAFELGLWFAIKRTDLTKNALRKLIGQALRNEIDVTEVWVCF